MKRITVTLTFNVPDGDNPADWADNIVAHLQSTFNDDGSLDEIAFDGQDAVDTRVHLRDLRLGDKFMYAHDDQFVWEVLGYGSTQTVIRNQNGGLALESPSTKVLKS